MGSAYLGEAGPTPIFLSPILRSAGIGSAQHCSVVNSWGWLDTLHFIDFLPGATEGNRLVSLSANSNHFRLLICLSVKKLNPLNTYRLPPLHQTGVVP